MKHTTISIIILFLIVPLFAVGADQGASRMAEILYEGKPLSIEDQRMLAVLAFHKVEAIKKPLLLKKLTGNESESAQARRALKILKTAELSQSKSIILGATMGWYLFYDQDLVTTIPLVVKVIEGSVADKAGLLPGDVIDTCDGIPLQSVDSRNKFVQFLSQWPESVPLEIRIRRSDYHDANSVDVKHMKRKLVLFKK